MAAPAPIPATGGPTFESVTFSFDPASASALDRIVEKGGFGSWGVAVREALRILEALQLQAEQGFTELIVRQPDHKQQRLMMTNVIMQPGSRPPIRRERAGSPPDLPSVA
jgi:hypothetical protein